MATRNPNFLYADYVRVLATLAVILLHCAGDLLYRFDLKNMNLSYWWTGNVYDSSVRWCVPMFILLSGALLLRPAKEETIPDFLKKRMMRVLVPYLFWSLIYVLYTNRGQIENFQIPYWPDVFYKIFFEDVYYHLWFIPMILGLYFLTPVFRVFVRHATRYEIEYFLIFWFYVSTLQIYFSQFFVIKFLGWLAYIGYLVLGDYLHTFEISKKNTTLIYRTAWLSLAITIWGTWQLSAYFGVFSGELYQYLSPNIIFMAVGIFLAFKNYDWESFNARNPRFHAAIKWLSNISFGIYLLHVLLIDVFKNAYLFHIKNTSEYFFNQPIHPIIGALFFTFLVTSLSVLIIYILNKIPYLEKIVK